jgi:hypothetical protein
MTTPILSPSQILPQQRNILAVHNAKLPSQKKHLSKIGAVHLTPYLATLLKPAFASPLLMPKEEQTRRAKRAKRNEISDSISVSC